MRKAECLGTMYQAEPVCEDSEATLPLELLSITFHSQYYSSTQGESNTAMTLIQLFKNEVRTKEAEVSGERD